MHTHYIIVLRATREVFGSMHPNHETKTHKLCLLTCVSVWLCDAIELQTSNAALPHPVFFPSLPGYGYHFLHLLVVASGHWYVIQNAKAHKPHRYQAGRTIVFIHTCLYYMLIALRLCILHHYFHANERAMMTAYESYIVHTRTGLINFVPGRCATLVEWCMSLCVCVECD